MSNSPEVRKYSYVSPPRAYSTIPATTGQVIGQPGQMVVVATTNNGTGYLDLSQLTFGGAYNASTNPTGSGAPSGQPVGLVGCYVTIACSALTYVVFGPTVASVTGSNAPSSTGTGTTASGLYTAAAGVCFPIFTSTYVRFLTQVGVDNVLAWLGTATGYIRIYQSSSPLIDG